MVYQLIYTSAARLLDSPLSGYGVVARSEVMPTALVRKLIDLSEYSEPTENGVAGPQFSYHIEECGSKIYHILTSVRSAGADYSQRSCHIAHHIALPENEVQALCERNATCTPAGVILAMELRRAWAQHWTKEPEMLPEDTPLPLDEIPSADNAPTWLVFTGSNANAQVFSHALYSRGGLFLVPPRTQARDVLRLLHEGFALLPSRGWDTAFCTTGNDTDTLDSATRLISVEGSSLHKRALRIGFPTLEIRPKLTLPPETEAAPAEAPAQPGNTTPAQGVQAAPDSARSLSSLPVQQPYKYEEDDSSDAFEKPWRRESRRNSPKYRLLIGIAIALTALGLGVALRTQAEKTETPPHPAHPVPEKKEVAEHHKKAPVHHAPAAPTATTPPPVADTPEPPAEVVQTPPAEPTATDDPLPPADESAQDEQPAEPELNQELAVTDPSIALIDDKEPQKLPDVLAAYLRNIREGEESTLVDGTYILCLRNDSNKNDYEYIFGSDKDSRFEVKLDTRQVKLIIHRRTSNEYKISVVGADQDIPTVFLKTDENVSKLTQLYTMKDGHKAAAIHLPLVNKEHSIVPVLLVPRIKLLVSPTSPLPAIENKIREAIAKDFKADSLADSLFDNNCELNAAALDTYLSGLIPNTEPIDTKEPKLFLPDFSYDNELEVGKLDKKKYHYSCEVKKSESGHYDTGDFEFMIHLEDTRSAIEESFKEKRGRKYYHGKEYISRGRACIEITKIVKSFTKIHGRSKGKATGRRTNAGQKEKEYAKEYRDLTTLYTNESSPKNGKDDKKKTEKGKDDELRGLGKELYEALEGHVDGSYILPGGYDDNDINTAAEKIADTIRDEADKIIKALKAYLSNFLKEAIKENIPTEETGADRYYIRLKKVEYEKEKERLKWEFEWTNKR